MSLTPTGTQPASAGRPIRIETYQASGRTVVTWHHVHDGTWRVSEVTPGPALRTEEFLKLQASRHAALRSAGVPRTDDGWS